MPRSAKAAHAIRLVAYLVVVLIGVTSILLYQRNLNDRFGRRDAVSCVQREALIVNQRLVLLYAHMHTSHDQIDMTTGRPWFIEFAEGLRALPVPSCGS